jgi:drug/metabolite transporter (DMT)-like permease
MDTTSLAVVLGLGSALLWGAGDFFGGVATRRAALYSVVIGSQVVGLLLITASALALGQPLPPLAHLAGGALAGLVGVVGLLALYQGLAVGRAGVVAPVSAVVGAGLPVLIGVFLLGLPGPTKLLGFALALVAVWLVSRTEGGAIQLADLRLPVLAGLSFGLFYVIISRVNSVSILWPIVAARLASLSAMTALTTARGQARLPACAHWPVVALSGALDAGGNALYAAAAAAGRLDVAAVLSSLFPASTILLARLVLREPISPSQWVGIGASLAAIVLISA